MQINILIRKPSLETLLRGAAQHMPHDICSYSQMNRTHSLDFGLSVLFICNLQTRNYLQEILHG